MSGAILLVSLSIYAFMLGFMLIFLLTKYKKADTYVERREAKIYLFLSFVLLLCAFIPDLKNDVDEDFKISMMQLCLFYVFSVWGRREFFYRRHKIK